MSNKEHDRAVRCRRLALAEPDKAKAALLLKIADETERGVLYTADQTLIKSAPNIKSAKPLS
jgi:hypothetical protein